METVVKFFSEKDLRVYVVVVLMVVVCAVPFAQVFTDLWRFHFKK